MGSWLMYLHSPCWLAALTHLARQLHSLDQPELQSLHIHEMDAIVGMAQDSTTSWTLDTKHTQHMYVMMQPLQNRSS